MQPQTGEDPQNAPKGPRFTKVYGKGLTAMKGLLADSPAAAQVYLFLVEQCDHHNAVSCPYSVMADELNMSERTIRRAIRLLEDREHIVIAKIGTANIYILNPREVWKTYEHHKRYCGFTTRTLISKTENGNIKERLTHVMQKQEILDLDPPQSRRKKTT